MPDAIMDVLYFVESGGVVLGVILGVAVVLWAIVFERFWYFTRVFPAYQLVCKDSFIEWNNLDSWFVKQIRASILSEASLKLRSALGLMKTIIVISPLLGLLGTVVGMIEVFDVLAATGTGEARAMAAGISKATIPTMAGMVVALTGLLFQVIMEQTSSLKLRQLSDSLGSTE